MSSSRNKPRIVVRLKCGHKVTKEIRTILAVFPDSKVFCFVCGKFQQRPTKVDAKLW